MSSKWETYIVSNEERDAGIVVCIDNSRFLIIRRSDIDERGGQWTIPGGHIDETDRSIEFGASRELKEETNLDCFAGDLFFLGEPKPKKYYFLANMWSGQVNISIPNPITNKIEHDDYKWATIEEIKEIDNSEIPIYLLEKALEMFKNE